jgi:hypothetical protein
MITTSGGQYFPQSGEDCSQVRIWAETVDTEWIALHMAGHDLHRDINAFLYLDAEDALHLAEELRQSVERQERQIQLHQELATESN